MHNTTNPAELYPSTTWEELPADLFLKTGSSPLVQGGTNSVKIAKANLPAEKLQVESHSMTRGTMNITGQFNPGGNSVEGNATGAFYTGKTMGSNEGGRTDSRLIYFDASRTWAGNTSAASPYTSAMGNGTPIEINPAHITLKAWKRLT